MLDVSPVTNTVTVGTVDRLDVSGLRGVRPVWTGDEPTAPTRVLAQVRAHGEPVPATAWTEDGAVVVVLDEPLRGVAPGQAVVLYEGEAVLGSATIDATSPVEGSSPGHSVAGTGVDAVVQAVRRGSSDGAVEPER